MKYYSMTEDGKYKVTAKDIGRIEEHLVYLKSQPYSTLENDGLLEDIKLAETILSEHKLYDPSTQTALDFQRYLARTVDEFLDGDGDDIDITISLRGRTLHLPMSPVVDEAINDMIEEILEMGEIL